MQNRINKATSKEAFSGGMAEAQGRYGYGQATIRKIAEDAGAVIRIGRTVRYNFSKMDRYLEGKSE